jgi:hypothetical protein
MEPDHPIVILRLTFVFLCALPAVRELYQYINDPRYVPINLQIDTFRIFNPQFKACSQDGSTLLAVTGDDYDGDSGYYEME